MLKYSFELMISACPLYRIVFINKRWMIYVEASLGMYYLKNGSMQNFFNQFGTVVVKIRNHMWCYNCSQSMPYNAVCHLA